jgi:hypothetical protein
VTLRLAFLIAKLRPDHFQWEKLRRDLGVHPGALGGYSQKHKELFVRQRAAFMHRLLLFLAAN